MYTGVSGRQASNYFDSNTSGIQTNTFTPLTINNRHPLPKTIVVYNQVEKHTHNSTMRTSA
jgi:hypothetical protein